MQIIDELLWIAYSKLLMILTSLTDDFAHGGHIGSDAKVSLCSAIRNTEASHDLVKDEKSTVLGGKLSQTHEELLGWLDEAGVAHHGLQNNCSHVSGIQ